MNITASIDYLSLTAHTGISAMHPMITNLPLEKKDSGLMGYTRTRTHLASGAFEMNNPDHPTMGTHVIHTGKTLAWLRDNNLETLELLEYHIGRGHKISRLDITLDAYDSDLNITKLANAVRGGYCDTNSKNHMHIKSNTGETLYIGSLNNRKKLLRIYDKGAEQGTSENWKRIELETHGRVAQHISGMLLSQGYSVIQGIIQGYASFPQDDTWLEIVTAPRIGIRIDEDNQSNTVKWLVEVCAPVLARHSLSDKKIMEHFIGAVLTEVERLKK